MKDENALTLSVIGITLIASTFLIYYAQIWPHGPLAFFRLLYLIPITLAAYRFGKALGVGIAFFCSGLFVPLAAILVSLNNAGEALELLGLGAFYVLYAYFVADLTAGLRRNLELSRTLSRMESLLDKALSPEEVSGILLDHALEACDAEWGEIALDGTFNGEKLTIYKASSKSIPPTAPTKSPQGAIALAEWVAAQKNPLLLYDLNDDPRILTVPGAPRVKSCVAMPLRREGAFRGYIALFRSQGEDFSPEAAYVLEDIGSRGMAALLNAFTYTRTEQALIRRVEELSAMEQIALALSASLNLEHITRIVMNRAMEITKAMGGLIALRSPETGELVPIVSKDVPRTEALRLTKLIREAAKGQRDEPVSLTDEGHKGRLMVAPILHDGDLLGAIVVFKPALSGESEKRFLRNLALHAAIAIQNASLFREVSEERLKKELVLRQIADGVFTTDLERRILTFNPAAEQITGLVADEVVGRTCCEVFNLTDDEGRSLCDGGENPGCALFKAFGCAAERRTFSCEGHFTAGDGRRRYISLSVAPLRDPENRVTGAVVTFRDLTREKELERMKNEFISMVSHQLRAPLTNIRASLELLREGTDPELSKELMDIVYTQSLRLSSFVDLVLEIMRIEEGRYQPELEPVSLRPLIHEVVDSFRARAQNRRFEIELPEVLPFAFADKRSLEIVLSNLLDNAVKYSPESGKVRVSARVRASEILISVMDEGPGIPPEHRDKIFERFYRIDGSDAQSTYGYGLGLYISKKLLEPQRGEIWVEDGTTKGLCVVFSIPQWRAEDGSREEDFDNRR